MLHVYRTGFYVPETLFAAKSHLDLDEFNGKLFNWTAPLEAGQNLTMSELAATLELISVKGPNGR